MIKLEASGLKAYRSSNMFVEILARKENKQSFSLPSGSTIIKVPHKTINHQLYE